MLSTSVWMRESTLFLANFWSMNELPDNIDYSVLFVEYKFACVKLSTFCLPYAYRRKKEIFPWSR